MADKLVTAAIQSLRKASPTSLKISLASVSVKHFQNIILVISSVVYVIG